VNTIKKDENGSDIIFQGKDLSRVEENGTKIQTGGWIFRNVSGVITQSGDNSCEKYKQLKILWKHTRSYWSYINEPADTENTWRSASETIEIYYFNTEKKHTGDCDDFAILMASFARQVGRFVCAVNTNTLMLNSKEKAMENGFLWIGLAMNSETNLLREGELKFMKIYK